MQNAVPSTFSKVEIAESGDYTGQLVAYDDENNICLRVVSNRNTTICFRDGSTLAVADFIINKVGVCANGVILYLNATGHVVIAKDHRGKIAFVLTAASDNAFTAFNGDTNASEGFSYGSGQEKDQTNLCRMMLPKGGTETNYMEHGFISEQYNLNTSPMVCKIAGQTYISCHRVHLMDK
jgi:small nuclear ribonucleoprotein (snRNP)-like protein